MLRRLCVVLTLGILMMVALTQGAAADPIGAKNSFQFPATCDGQTVQLTVNGSGDFMPGLVVGSTTVLVVEAFDITFQFSPPPEGSPRSERPPGPTPTCTGTW
jgi:hypothetical protein